MKKPPSKKQWIGLTAQSPRMYCHCEKPQAVNVLWSWVLVCSLCKLVVWR
jgi:hypothetical protein